MKKLVLCFWIMGFMMALPLGIGCSSSKEHRFHGASLPGVIENVDLQSHKLTLNDLKSSRLTELSWSEDSRFWANGTPIEPRQLQRGDAVNIHVRNRDGHLWVQHLYLQTNRTIQ